MVRDMTKDHILTDIVAGRSLDEQIEDVRRRGSHATADQLRQRILDLAGITYEKKQARNVIHFGCYPPFRIPSSLRSYLTVLERLGIEYTFLPKREYCCGLPMVELTRGEERERAWAASREFIAMNMSMAQELGAKNMVYFCLWCAALGKKHFPNGPMGQLYYPEIMIEGLQNQPLRVQPAVVGYYAGCQSRITGFDGAQVDDRPYRQILDHIEGLRVVDLPKWCCVQNSARIIEKARSSNVAAIVTYCPSCNLRLGAAGRGKMRMKYLPDLLLSALDGGVV